jgi:1-acyl-sn-glycerol-3-phosphate acyltransferase
VLYWLLKWVFVGPWLRLFFRTEVRGLENIPAEGPVVLVGNHLSFVDSIFMPLYVRRPVRFLAKSEYFTGKGLKGWFTRVMMRGTGQLPIDRSGGKASEASLNTGLRVLADGHVLALYPEGTRSPDGHLYRGRTGAARTILAAGCPVVPVAVRNTDRVMPIGSKWPRRVPLAVIAGPAMDFTRFAGMEGDRFVLRSITDEMMHALQELSGQEYRDVYASSVRRRLAVAAQG